MANELLHLVELLGRRLDIVITEGHAADGGGADVIGDVDADTLLFQSREIFPERLPIGLNAEEIQLSLAGAANGVVHWRNGFTFAGDLRGDALIDF